MAVRNACMRKPLAGLLAQALGFSERRIGYLNLASVRALAATSQPTGRTGSGSATNVSGQKDQEAAAEEGAPPPDSAFDAGGAAGSADIGGNKEKGAVNSEHTQNFDQEKGRGGGKASIGHKGTREYSTFAALHATPTTVSQLGSKQNLREWVRRFSSSVETPTIDQEKAMSDKDFLRSSPGGAALEDDKEQEEDPKEGTSPWGGEGEKAEEKGKPIGRQMGSGSATNMSGSADEGAGDIPPDSGFDAGGSMNMDEGKHKEGRDHTQNFDDEMKVKGGSKEAVN